MYEVKPHLTIGFHGCERSVRDHLLMNPEEYKISQKPFDWLGHGLYFWENNYERALEWAANKMRHGKIKQPAVLGAVLSLGYCCDFLEKRFIDLLPYYFNLFKIATEFSGKKLPRNKDLNDDIHKDKLLRELDCATIEFMHSKIVDGFNEDRGKKGYSKYKLFDSTRGVFTEGGPAFDGSGIFAKSHIQICIRNPNCIQGFFMPRKEIDFIQWLQRA